MGRLGLARRQVTLRLRKVRLRRILAWLGRTPVPADPAEALAVAWRAVLATAPEAVAEALGVQLPDPGEARLADGQPEQLDR